MLYDGQGRNTETNKYFPPPPPPKLLWKKYTGWTLIISLFLGIHYIIPADTPALGYLTWVFTLLTAALPWSEEAAMPKELYSTLALHVPGQQIFHINWKIPHVVGSDCSCALIFCSHILIEPSMPSYQLFPEFNYC